MTNFSTGMPRVITGKYFSVQYIIQYIVVPTKSDSDVNCVYNCQVKNKVYTPLDLTRIDRSLVYLSYPMDRINTQVTYQL